MKKALSAMYGEIGYYIQPLIDAASDRDALEYLLQRHGWNVQLDSDLFDELIGSSNLAGSVESFVGQLERLRASEIAGSSIDAPGLAALIEASSALFTDIEQFPDTDLTRLPEPIASAATWSEFADAVTSTLTADYLAMRFPRLYATLVLVGVVETHLVVAQPPFRRAHELHRVVWERITDFLADPEDHLRRLYRWNEPEGLDHPRLLAALAGLARANGLEADLDLGLARGSEERFIGEVVRPLTTEQSLRIMLLERQDFRDGTFSLLGVDVIPVKGPETPRGDGLLLGPVIEVGSDRDLVLTRALTLTLDAAASLGVNTGLVVRPGDSHWTAALGASEVQLELVSTGEAPRYLMGQSDTAHVSVSGVRGRIRIDSDATTLNAEVVLGLGGTLTHRGLHVHIPLEETDGLISGLIPKDSLDLQTALEFGWSSRNGFQFAASGGLGIDLPFAGEIGPIALLPGRVQLAVAVVDGATRAALQFTAGIQVAIGPVTLIVKGVGLEVVGRPTSPRLQDNDPPPALLMGDIALDIGFIPPAGVGVSVDGALVSGGGFLQIDRGRGRYSGMLELSLAGLTVTAVGVLDTKDAEGSDLPDPGFSLLIIMSVEFPAIQLGFGFTLSGVGGLIGVYRDSNYELLKAGLTTGALDSVMFPQDPMANVDQVIRDVTTLFPQKRDRHVVGPMLLLGWGTPTLVRIEVGVLVVFGVPAPVQILGQLSAELPSSDQALIRLNIDVIGEVDFIAGTLKVDAALRGSSLIGFPLTGEAALRARWTGPRSFALSFGGRHPDAPLEPPLPDLKRLSLTISEGSNLRITAEAYLAVTSNSVQFGVYAELYGSAAGFSVEGFLEMHMLIILSPFSFAAAVAIDVSLKFKGRSFASVGLAVEASGPRPWRVKGKLKIKIAFVTFHKNLNISWGSSIQLIAPPRSVWPDLEAALSNIANWASILPPAERQEVRVLPRKEADLVALHPHGVLEIRQQVVPFDLELEQFGAAGPQGDNRFETPTISVGGTPATGISTVDEEFAPGQFLNLTEDEKLSRPSFESMPAGISFGSITVRTGTARDYEVTYETRIVGPDRVSRPVRPQDHLAAFAPEHRIHRLSDQSRIRDTTLGGGRYRNNGRQPAFTIEPERYGIAETTTGTVSAGTVSSVAAASQTIRRTIPTFDQGARNLITVGTTELK